MRIRLLQGVVLLLMTFNGESWAIELKNETLLQRVEHNLALYRLDSCLYYSYLLAHSYRLNSDLEHLTSTWYNIAFFELLGERFTRARAARQIAEQYAAKTGLNTNGENKNQSRRHSAPDAKTIEQLDALILYRNTYWSIYYYMKDAFTSTSVYLTKAIKHNAILSNQLQYLLRLYEGDTWYNLHQQEKGGKIIESIIEELTTKHDTACFAYGYGYYLLGIQDYFEYDYENCIKNLEKAMYCFENHRLFSKFWFYSYMHIIGVFRYMGQHHVSDKYFQQLSGIVEKNHLLKTYLPYYYFVKGRILRYKTEFREALDAYLKAYYSCNFESTDKGRIANYILDCYFTLGQHNKVVQWSDSCKFYRLDDYEKVLLAHSYYRLGNKIMANLLIRSVTSVGLDNRNLLGIAFLLSNFCFETGNSPEAEYYYKAWLNFALKKFGRVHYSTAFAYSSIAYFYWMAKADYAKSLYYYHRNVYSLINDDYNNDYYALPDITYSINDRELASALNNKAEALYEVSKQRKLKTEKVHDLKTSLANLEIALTVAHRYKMSLSRDEDRLSFADFTKRKYPYIINICLDLYHITSQQVYAHKAFEYAEKSKASILLSTVQGINASKMHLVPDSLKKEEDQLWTKTELLSRTLSEEYNKPKPNLDKIDQYNNTLNQLRKQQDSLTNIYNLHYPVYYNAKFNAEVISADSLQKMLKPDEAMLQYSLSSDKMVIFLLTKKDFKIFTDTLSDSFFKDVEAYREKMSGFVYEDLLDTSIRAYAAAAHQLYNRLIKPAEPFIKGKKLIIIPDDVLTQIPFEALVTKPLLSSAPGSLRNLAYLIKTNTISYSYSGTLYAMYHQKSVYHKAKLLAVAPSYKKTKTSQLYAHDTINTRRDSAELLPIPGTFEEVKDIHRIFGGNTLLKGRATEKQFKEVAGNYDILHLAMHGIINNEYPMFSKLVFVPDNDSINDGFLNTYEIYNMQINAPLVVLSACNTGYGKLHKGEGMISLSRGFFTAGAKSIVMTLWSVGDKTSSMLMNNFYNNLATKQNVSEAMQNAKLRYLEQSDEMKAHPYFWAGYIVLGNIYSTFEPDPPKTKYFLWISIGAILIISGALLKKKIRRSI